MKTKEQELKEALEQIKSLVKNVEGKIEALKLEKEDKLAELKEAHKNGAVIQFYSKVRGRWVDVLDNNPIWSEFNEYRIKPEEKPKVGDVCKLWDWDENMYAVARLEGVIGDTSFPYASDPNARYRNAKKLTKEEAIELLFGSED